MIKLEEHPTVIRYREKNKSEVGKNKPNDLDATQLRALCLELGADDVGFVNIDCQGIQDQREEIKRELPKTRSIIVIACKINRENIRTTAHSLADSEFLGAGRTKSKKLPGA